MSIMLPVHYNTSTLTICELCDRRHGITRSEINVDLCICDACFEHATSTTELFDLLMQIARAQHTAL
jgi:hypothetical protein